MWLLDLQHCAGEIVLAWCWCHVPWDPFDASAAALAISIAVNPVRERLGPQGVSTEPPFGHCETSEGRRKLSEAPCMTDRVCSPCLSSPELVIRLYW
jgi:hypothetical protein